MENTEPKKFFLEQEELSTLQEIRNEYTEVTAKLGQLKIEKLMVDKQYEILNKIETDLIAEYFEIQAKDVEINTKLVEKYGGGNIDMQTGVFTPTIATV